MSRIIEAEYKVVQERTLEVIAAEIRTIDAQMCQAVLQGAIEIGRRLKEAKEQVGHGNWEAWCRENLNYSKDWAGNMMRITEKYGVDGSLYFAAVSNPDMCRDLSISKALKLLKVPEEDIENFVSENNPAKITVKELEEKISDYKSNVERLERRLTESTEAQIAKMDEVERLKAQIEEIESDKEGDTEEVKAAHVELEKALKEKEKAEERAVKLKEKLDKEKAAQVAAAEKVKEEAKKEAQDAVRKELQREIEEAEKAKAIAEEAAQEATEREAAAIAKLGKAANPDLAVFAVKRQILHENYKDMLEVIGRTVDLEQREKFAVAAQDVPEQLRKIYQEQFC